MLVFGCLQSTFRTYEKKGAIVSQMGVCLLRDGEAAVGVIVGHFDELQRGL